jgi:hypothetical protein
MHPCDRGWDGVHSRYSDQPMDYSTRKRRSILGTVKKCGVLLASVVLFVSGVLLVSGVLVVFF